MDILLMPGKHEEAGSVRYRILAAALKLFVEQGYHSTSMPEIVEESGTSIGAVYHHFEGKDDLAATLHRQLVDQFVTMTDAEVFSIPDARGRIAAFVGLLFRLAEDKPDFVSYLIHARPSSVVEDDLTVCSKEGFEATRRIICEGQEAGEVRELDGSVLCGMVSGTIIRMIDLRFDAVITVPLTSLIDDTTAVIWAGVKA